MMLTEKKNKIPRHPSEMLGGDNPQSGVLAGAGLGAGGQGLGGSSQAPS